MVGNQPFYAAIGVDLAGHRDVLGLWAGKGGGEGIDRRDEEIAGMIDPKNDAGPESAS